MNNCADSLWTSQLFDKRQAQHLRCQPAGYDPNYWELFRRYITAANISSIGQVRAILAALALMSALPPASVLPQVIGISPLPNEATDINNNGPISTDFIGGAWNYPNATPAGRLAIYKAHLFYTQVSDLRICLTTPQAKLLLLCFAVVLLVLGPRRGRPRYDACGCVLLHLSLHF